MPLLKPSRVIIHSPTPPMTRPARKPLGLGDVVAKVATPIAKALSLPCIDPETKAVKSNSPCDQKKNALNRVLPNVNPFA